MPIWTLHGDGRRVAPGAVVKPHERLGWGSTVAIGAQHVVAMFGATFLVPLLTGFPVSTTLLFSGLGTLLFLVLTRNKLPSYLGSSFAFIAPITAFGPGDGAPLDSPEQIGQALVGVFVAGVLLAGVGFLVQATGTRWLERLMPPVVSGAIVALIGLNLAPAAWNNFKTDAVLATITLVACILFAVLFRGFLGRISIFLGVVVGYVAALIMGRVDFSGVEDLVEQRAWIGLPTFHLPSFGDPVAWGLLPMFLPVVLVLVAENVGHVRGVATMTGDPTVNTRTGRALLADGLATTLAGAFGGSGTTTYGENIGVMAATRIYSTAAYWVAGIIAVLLSFSPVVGAVLFTIPSGVIGGVTTALYGLIGVIGIKIWVDNQVDFSRPVNQYTVAVAFVIAIANFTMDLGQLQFGGIVLGTVAALVVYHAGNAIARARRTGADDGGPIVPIGQLGGDPD
ncbi:NCS2 family nucleobase:cation symporter [Microbacterium sp. EYE_5]|uniref:uracil-xanthine permease family protein n=1 Tax=unclassified Microbacterium TaxID=2609290 RepID=UPI0020030BCC|nr:MULTISPECIES: solute carrier family 23 protein [unclassified Microbacterium]MCK6079684.1 NCS2 family nucleobase:cation symporter [Microbacterium sp. EYE_382]MCK6084955.1 NCS2 family nucleobase:cation symporter [Microbacterium sp. EYE_384]MCK6122819.1 NCS2 family nucleobase:cation symporter [Microbacterium sp. EYE_80]MCK6125718.1 NCS2 family nucleobase:cation symporter [Microbacterium sp. EYE_79]MCK6140639.1 NCS2 family nucleobase:cation symporter [Microbacterium sp. EYE_39]